MPKVLIADKLSPAALQVFDENGVETDVKTDMYRAELLEIIGEYDGLVVRSRTRPDEELIAKAIADPALLKSLAASAAPKGDAEDKTDDGDA